jgi:cellulose synthase/poly-beta-1,6-N-acetylglucosamine synthase-like glycosyltransferase
MPSARLSKNQTRKRTLFPYEIAIPSYKRPETLREKTLAVLKQYKLPAEKITVFVADAEQKKLYEDALVPGSYGKIIVGIVGMGAIRNFITSWYPVGTKIVNIDDDIRGFLEYDATKPRKEKPLRSLLTVIKRGFDECEKVGARLWGVYPVANGFFMKPKVSTDLKYVIGSFWGCINPGIKQVKITLDDKEDYQRSILYYKLDDAIVRLNFVAPVSSYYKEPGGMQEERTKQRVEKSARWLVKEYPEFAVLNPSKKSGYMEVRLKDMRESKKAKTEDEQ